MKWLPLSNTSLLGRLGMAVSSVLALVVGFALASVLLAIVLVVGLALGGWLWWQYRRLLGRSGAAPSDIIEGEYTVMPEHPALEDRRTPSTESADSNKPATRRVS